MKKKHPPMRLGSLVRNLIIPTKEKEKEISNLEKLLLKTQLPDDIRKIKASNFSFEEADLSSIKEIPDASAEPFKTKAQFKTAEAKPAEFKVFVRETPAQSTMMEMSMPSWANGAAINRSVGPFQSIDGRQFWFDFFRIEKFVALYIQGQPFPALLFKYKPQRITTTPTAALQKKYFLKKGSIWIRSQLLAAAAPSDYYTGLTIKEGEISMNIIPLEDSEKITIPKKTRVNVKLTLAQQPIKGVDKKSPFGKDARSLKINLPENLEFHFSGQYGGKIDEVGNSNWKLFDQKIDFKWQKKIKPTYDNQISQVLIPCKTSVDELQMKNSRSPFCTLKGNAPIASGSWALPAAPIDLTQPTAASGIGSLLVQCEKGISTQWKGLEGDALHLKQPYFQASPGSILLLDLMAGSLSGKHDLKLYKDNQNTFGTSVQLLLKNDSRFFYYSYANGNEGLLTQVDADVQIDRPVTVCGKPVEVKSKESVLVLAVNKNVKLIFLWDDNIIFDNIDFTQKKPELPKPISLALENALFKTTPVNGCLLSGFLADDYKKIKQGQILLTFGLLAYIPTLPDPYAVNLGALERQFFQANATYGSAAFYRGQAISAWLICKMIWEPNDVEEKDDVEVSFHFGPLSTLTIGASSADTPVGNIVEATETSNLAAADTVNPVSADESFRSATTTRAFAFFPEQPLPDYDEKWRETTNRFQRDHFALLDVSTNADLLGVSFQVFSRGNMMMVPTHGVPGATPSGFPFQIDGMELKSQGFNARVFTSPQISWEPVFNLTKPVLMVGGDPDLGFNYYPDDGGPTRILNLSDQQVALAPIPLTNFLIHNFDVDDNFKGFSFFNLPFGLKVLAFLQNKYSGEGINRRGSKVKLNNKTFENDIKGGLQFEIHAGKSPKGSDSDTFEGNTIQINNILDLNGNPTGDSTLGKTVTEIFNGDFFFDNTGNVKFLRARGVPLTRIDLSGYGASVFSNWTSPSSIIAATSQAKFDVFKGRCAHEIIQVKSIIYPWAARCVRTVSLFKTGSGYVYRYDSGWQPESDGIFDFFYVVEEATGPKEKPADYEIHPGVIKGLYNIKDIQEVPSSEINPFTADWKIGVGDIIINEDTGKEEVNNDPNLIYKVKLQPVYFKADVEIENPVNGFVVKKINGQNKKLIPSKKILGFVQISPKGMLIPIETFRDLIESQLGSIGGSIDCVIDIGNSGQQMRLHRFDVSNATTDADDSIFVNAGRGNVILPKDGSWSMVKHELGTGEVTPVPDDLSVPLIREGKLKKVQVVASIITPSPSTSEAAVSASETVLSPVDTAAPAVEVELVPQLFGFLLDPSPAKALLRIADPGELVRTPVNDTLNYGFLLSTDTQKALFLTPSFKLGLKELLSKTPPLFVDGFRLASSKAIFPNVGNAINDFGDAISLLDSSTRFETLTGIQDVGSDVLKLMQINKDGASTIEKGYKLLKQNIEDGFTLPNTVWPLITHDDFKIYIEYKVEGDSNPTKIGELDFDIDSFGDQVEDKWKSVMNDVSIVADLGVIDRLVSIRGTWDSKKGSSSSFAGGSSFPSPEMKFADELQPIVDILQILAKLQTEDYAGAIQDGLKLAMSNKSNSWEYKLEATKEIPLVRFPPNPMFTDPNAPLKLEAGLKFGVFFNAALPVSTDTDEWLPTAGVMMGFYGELSVMCVSLSAATLYAVGRADLEIAADSKSGASLRMEFGFGVQLVVGLPVIGSVSITYMAGVEIYLVSSGVDVSAFLLFKGHASIAGGLVGITIYIEGRGTISRANDRTDMTAQMTFGIDISIAFVINISFEESWEESRQIA